jgi:hypothetical protein
MVWLPGLQEPNEESEHKVRAGPRAEPAGESGYPLPFKLLSFEERRLLPPTTPDLSRRSFLALGAAALAGALGGCADRDFETDAAVTSETGGVTVFRLSSRGRRTSNAAKKHNANHLFTTAAAANGHRAHPGDRSKIVQVTISRERFNSLFTNPARTDADLRQV